MKYTDKMAEFNSLWMEQNEIYRRAAKNFGISESVFWILYSLTEAGGTLRQSVISAMTWPAEADDKFRAEKAGIRRNDNHV